MSSKDVSYSKSPKLEKESDNGMKYIQILFYYVQDSALFKVHLPVDGQQGESIVVKILEFSPEVLVSIYVKTVYLCFSYGLTAVTKVFAKSVFGYCVMLFIFLMYLVQKGISRFVYKDSDFWIVFRSRSVQAFIMTVLFSFQKLVIGAFSLVQCVQILNKKVLYIEGDIECYTWWQQAVQIYICINVIPLLFIVSRTPFYVQDKTMSVKMFILNCLFPLPAFVYFTAKRLTKAESSMNLSKFTVSSLVHLAAVRFLRKSKKVSGLAQETAPDVSMVEFTQQTVSQSYSGPDDIEIPFIDASVSSNASEGCLRHRSTSADSVASSTKESLAQARIENRVQTSVCDRCLGYIHTGKCFQDSEIQTSPQIETTKKNYCRSCLKRLEFETNDNELHDNALAADSVKHTKNEEAILDTLLKHYKCLQVRGIRFNWLGIHQAYRVILVVCNTYITEPLPKLWAMTTALMLIAVANTFMKPYQDDKANKTAVLSYAANLCIAMMNIGKTFLATFSCKTNCSVVDTLLWYFSVYENILLIYLPVAALVVWVIYVGVQKFRSKDKGE